MKKKEAEGGWRKIKGKEVIEEEKGAEKEEREKSFVHYLRERESSIDPVDLIIFI